MKIQEFFDKSTSTLTYVVFDEKVGEALVIDPVLDFDMASGRVWGSSAEQLTKFVLQNKLQVQYILETHAHADHLSAAQILKNIWPQAQLAIGEGVKKVQSHFKSVFHLEDFKADGSQFDLLLKDGQILQVGQMAVKVLAVPGHTPSCMAYLVEDAIFTGDAIFMPDSGTGRCDFPNGSAEELYTSIVNRIYSLPDATRIFVGHDYQPEGRKLLFQTTVGEQKANNIQLKATSSKAQFIGFRETRDRSLPAPRLLLPSIQFNMAAGHFPMAESNHVSYFKLPLKIDIS